MKYRLGLDLGVGSIGSAVIELDNENNAKDIIDAGVRILKFQKEPRREDLKEQPARIWSEQKTVGAFS